MRGRVIRLVLWAAGGVALLAAGCNQLPLGHGPSGTTPSVTASLPGREPPRTPQAATPQPAPVQQGPIQGLDAFLRDLQDLEAGKIQHVRILQLGDSHTAGDAFTARLRALLQERFGDGGRGMMPPGLPFDGVRQREVKIAQTGRWTVENSRTNPNGGPYGVSGFVLRSGARDARISAAPVEPEKFDSAAVDFLRRPGGGSFEVRIDGQLLSEIATAGPLGQAGHIVVPAPSGAKKLEIVAKGPGIGLTGWSLERKDKGVILDSHGVISATIGITSRWDPNMVKRDLDVLRPSLIVLAYGTNEGFAPDIDPTYAKSFAGAVEMLKQLAPRASILVIGPPDGQKIDPACRSKGSDPLACRWTTPLALEAVRNAQREVARGLDIGFWDWSSLMTGPRGIDALVRTNPPLARGDHVHFTLPGYEMAADALFKRLMDDYAAFRDGAPQAARRM